MTYLLCKEAFASLEKKHRSEVGFKVLTHAEENTIFDMISVDGMYPLTESDTILVDNSIYQTMTYLQNEGFDTCDPEICKILKEA